MSDREPSNRGPLAWMARNHVAANLLMLILIVGGLLFVPRIKQEVFPEATLDMVTVSIPYPGASPDEVEQGVVLSVEEAIQGIDGVKEIRSVAAENVGSVSAELFSTANENQALNDIQSAVDRITSFPRDAEEPVIRLASNRREVVSLIFHGDVDRRTLDRIAEEARSALLLDERITLVEIGGLPPPEISIEVPQETLRRFGLSLPEIARRVAASSVELGGGGVKTPGGEVLVRTTERRDLGEEFRDLAVISRPDGTIVRLADMANIVDGYRETEEEAWFDGERAVRVSIFRIGDQTPLELSAAAHEYLQEARARLPDTVEVSVWNDTSEIYEDRITLLLKNGFLGLMLVVLILGMFLQLRLAFWVMLGMATAFVGAFLFMPALNVSINMISLFAFLLVLGIVVDDAIVVGEAVYYQSQHSDTPLKAAIAGVREVAGPVVFSVTTTIIAFLPLLFVPGVTGKFFANIPLIVIPILILSLVESLFVLPAHLGHLTGGKPRLSLLRKAHEWQQRFSDAIERFIKNKYAPFAEWLLRHRYLTLSASIALLVLVAGLVAGGRIQYHFFPRIEGDIMRAEIELPFGAPVADTRAVIDKVVEDARTVMEAYGGEEEISRGIYAELGSAGAGDIDPDSANTTQSASHLASVAVFLVPMAQRTVTGAEFSSRWREKVGSIPGVERLAFDYSVGAGAGADVAIELSHENTDTLEAAASRLAESLSSYEGVFDVDDGFERGKEQLDLKLKPAAKTLGISEEELARQVRGAFFGAEALRQQRDRHELRVYVRLPREQRESEYHIETLMIQTPGGGEIPLNQAAEIQRVESFTHIEREQGRRVVNVTADVDPDVTSGGDVTDDLAANVLPGLMADVPGLSWELSGEQQQQMEAMQSLRGGVALALFAMFSLLAIAFRSYIQPAIVLFAIPFGLVGAIGGHFLMGFDLSLISLFGMVALAGVVVNDSLVLISVINDMRREGKAPLDAIRDGSVRRFRPILLTSLTTFFGLSPMIFETSVQARFLIPMAISLGFGVLFVTVIALVIVPACYMAVEDLKGLFRNNESQKAVA